MAVYLLVANETAGSPELARAVLELHQQDADAEFEVLVPATPLNLLHQLSGSFKSPGALAAHRAQGTRRRLEQLGLRVRSTRIGNWDPFVAIEAELVQGRYDGVVISTLPPGVSRWLRMDLPSRVARGFPEIRLIHVVARLDEPLT